VCAGDLAAWPSQSFLRLPSDAGSMTHAAQKAGGIIAGKMVQRTMADECRRSTSTTPLRVLRSRPTIGLLRCRVMVSNCQHMPSKHLGTTPRDDPTTDMLQG
jgi:hypothetical protein